MSVQRWTMQHLVGKVGLTLDADSNGEWVTYADHARIVAEKDDALAAALADYEMDRQTWEAEKLLAKWDAEDAAAPRTLTADDARAAVARMRAAARQPAYDLGLEAALVAIDALIHDGEATP